jgi:hypothetical protein
MRSAEWRERRALFRFRLPRPGFAWGIRRGRRLDWSEKRERRKCGKEQPERAAPRTTSTRTEERERRARGSPPLPLRLYRALLLPREGAKLCRPSALDRCPVISSVTL